MTAPSNPHPLNAASLRELATVHPRLQAVVNRTLLTLPFDIRVTQGARSDHDCYVNFGKGRTPAECEAGGCPPSFSQPKLAKVTWLGHALSSNHRIQPDGYGHAVDLLPAPYDYRDLHLFTTLAQRMLDSAHELVTPIRWGADWNSNGKPGERGETDYPHFELRPISAPTAASATSGKVIFPGELAKAQR